MIYKNAPPRYINKLIPGPPQRTPAEVTKERLRRRARAAAIKQQNERARH